ncbi:lipopolysaccharide biosynthesis protein [Ferruginibacter sp. SUN106]|uniref:lipopolysaccharide biosynthesis protein n=1 Tax=Ferruginibacter sp. SUN106 TaxID=2978348 RepID=UPI003D35EE4A
MSITSQVREGLKNPAFKSVGTYIFTNFFSKGISFLLIPLFTNPLYLSPTDNGLLSLFSSNMILLAPFVSLGMIQSCTADFYKKSESDFAASFTSSFIISFLMAALAAILLFIFRDMLQQKFQFPTSFVFILPGLAFLIFSGEQLFALIRNRNEVKRFAIMGISKSIIEYAVSVVLIVFFLTGWMGRIWGIAISLIVVNLIAVVYYIKNKYISFQFKKTQLIDELKFGVPIFAFQLCVFMLGTSNKLFLAIYNVDKYQLGIYSIACVFGTMIGVVSQSILLYAQPQLYKSISKGEATIQTAKRDFLRYFMMLTGLSVACILVVLFAYYFLIDKVYLSGIKYFFLVALASYIWGLNYFLFLFLLYHKQKRKILKVTLISLACSITVNIIMVKNFLILGDALASLINTIIFSLLIIIFAQKIIKDTLTKKIIPAVAE